MQDRGISDAVTQGRDAGVLIDAVNEIWRSGEDLSILSSRDLVVAAPRCRMVERDHPSGDGFTQRKGAFSSVLTRLLLSAKQ